ncbi:MAG: exosortase K [Clostridium sp.]|nr:exosortase K [Clostridium sp.]
MTFKKAPAILKGCWIYYLLGFALILGMKYFYSRAGANELKWILTPTAWWVRHLSGIPFEYETDVGYINYNFRFIIAASCSGVQFMMIAVAALIFSFVHRMETTKKGLAWVAFSLGISYLFTIFVNGLRIIVSIYLPLYAGRPEIHRGPLTPERLHTLIGISVYFTALFTLYQIAELISRSVSQRSEKPGEANNAPQPLPSYSGLLWKCIPPVFWYFAIVLGIPFLNRAYEHDRTKFMEYAVLMAAVCVTVTALYCLAVILRRRLGRPRS